MSVAGSKGSPTTSASIASMKRDSNSSATASTTMKRLAAMQDWPLFCTRAVTAVRTAASRSAEASTMKGSEPPSSSTVFLRASPAAAATDMPAGSLPVSVTAAMRGSWMSAATSSDGTKRLVKTPSGRPARRNRSSMASGGLRHVRRVLEQPDVAHHERRRGEADHLPHREVPRHDGQHGADAAGSGRTTSTRWWRSARRPAAPRRCRRTSAGRRRTWTPRPWPRRTSCPSRW